VRPSEQFFYLLRILFKDHKEARAGLLRDCAARNEQVLFVVVFLLLLFLFFVVVVVIVVIVAAVLVVVRFVTASSWCWSWSLGCSDCCFAMLDRHGGGVSAMNEHRCC